MELWTSEKQTKNLKLDTRISKILFNEKSNFQEVAIVDSNEFGRMLVLDGVFQTSIKDEFVYHEMISHIPLFTHPDPQKVLIIGGGDGGTAREVLKHDKVKSVDMVEIDGLVVEVSKRYLPEISFALNNPDKRFNLIIGDGIKHVAAHKNYYDVIIVDCSDPVGPGEGLFTTGFYIDLHACLKNDGLFVQQTESPWYHQELIKYIYKEIDRFFPVVKMYLAYIPLYPGGMHSFIMGSKEYKPLLVTDFTLLREYNLKYLNAACFTAAFVLPEFVEQMLA